MFEFLRKYVDSLTGITELPRERAEQLVTELQQRGEVRVKDIRKAAEQLVERSTRNRRELVSLIQKEMRRQVKALGLATQDDVDKLARRVKALESGAKPSAARTSRPAAKKGAVAKKPATRKATTRRTTGPGR